ncbi:MAG: glycosyltransferase family 2 protein [Lentimicrobium sp.]
MLSIIIPAYNEAESITDTIKGIHEELVKENILHEILVINDNSRDRTLEVLDNLSKDIKTLRILTNHGPNGFGYAIRKGLESFNGNVVAIMMADLSDSPKDLVKYYRTLNHKKVDAVFGSRFIKGGETVNYPFFKKIINRMANTIIRLSFRIKYNDTTNAFKMYRKETIDGLKPFLAPHFNLTIELPLKVIIRGYSYSVIPISWQNRKYGKSNLKIREMGSRYFFILLYCLIEKYFSRGDFRKKW